jgi:hypothetical protein
LKHVSAAAWFLGVQFAHAFGLYLLVFLSGLVESWSKSSGSANPSSVFYMQSLVFALGQAILAAVLSYSKGAGQTILAILIPILALDVLFCVCFLFEWGKFGIALPYLTLAVYLIRALTVQEP